MQGISSTIQLWFRAGKKLLLRVSTMPLRYVYIARLVAFIAFVHTWRIPWLTFRYTCTACEHSELGVGHRGQAVLGYLPCHSWLSIRRTQSTSWPSVCTAGVRSSTAISFPWHNHRWGIVNSNTPVTIVFDSFDLGYCHSRLHSLSHVLSRCDCCISLLLLANCLFRFSFFVFHLSYYILSHPIPSYLITSHNTRSCIYRRMRPWRSVSCSWQKDSALMQCSTSTLHACTTASWSAWYPLWRH